jgi:hypothetical protein
MTVWSSHSIQDLISHKALNSISPSCVQILHSFLLQPDLTFRWYQQLNPATLLPWNIPPNSEPPAHDCIELLDDSLKTFHHILDSPIPNAPIWFIDNISTKASSTSTARAGYTIVQGHPIKNTYNIIVTNSLRSTATSQQAELYALTWALQRVKDKTVIFYTDSKYKYIIIHFNTKYEREQGLTTKEFTMQNILQPFYMQPVLLTKLPSFTVRDIKRAIPSYLLPISWQIPQLKMQPNKHPPSHSTDSL